MFVSINEWNLSYPISKKPSLSQNAYVSSGSFLKLGTMPESKTQPNTESRDLEINFM